MRLIGTKSNRDGIGAVVKIAATADPRWREQFNHMTTAVGYASSSGGPVHFGTGAAKRIDSVEIRWPSGTVQVLGTSRPTRCSPCASPAETRRAGTPRRPGPRYARIAG